MLMLILAKLFSCGDSKSDDKKCNLTPSFIDSNSSQKNPAIACIRVVFADKEFTSWADVSMMELANVSDSSVSPFSDTLFCGDEITELLHEISNTRDSIDSSFRVRYVYRGLLSFQTDTDIIIIGIGKHKGELAYSKLEYNYHNEKLDSIIRKLFIKIGANESEMNSE